MSDNKRPILYNGEIYGKAIQKSSGFGEKFMRLTYEEARENVLKDLQDTKSALRQMPQRSRLPNEVVLSLVIQPEFTAKSYYPDSLFDLGSKKFGITEIGSRVWRQEEEDDNDFEKTLPSKMFFIRATEKSLDAFEKQLNKREGTLLKSFTSDIRKVSSLGLLPSNDQILGVSDNWKSGRLEAVLHPFQIDREKSLAHFLDLIREFDVDLEQVRHKQYQSGVSFISFKGNRDVLSSLAGYNPLRTIHPLKMRDLPNFSRGQIMPGGPKPPIFTKKPSIVVGVIDGDIHKENPYIKNYVESEFLVSGSPLDSFRDHGTQVSGAVLYGPLNKYKKDETLPEPPVSVKSFGVLSDESNDPELYDAIDAIEKIVPSNKDIAVYNLSLGPEGPILDDSLSRFTYSCDLLSKDFGVLFCIAVGNDGDISGFDRIQAPADSVNGLSVGAYTKRDGHIIRAPYSSIGPGREGCKMKPDVVAFGGCDQHPIHLVASEIGEKTWNLGTSFASPLVANIAARLIGESNNVIDALIAKTLITHSTKDKNSSFTNEMGHGPLPDKIEEITTCVDNSYTLIYKGEIEAGKYAEFPIPWDNSIQNGTANFKWTAAVLTDVDQLNTDDYTSSTIELTFHPNKNKYLFRNVNNTLIDGKYKKTEIVDVEKNPERARLLIEGNWQQSNIPITNSPSKQFETELDLRADLKWDSLDTRVVNKRANGLNEPVFNIHALNRGSRIGNSKVKFALVLSVTAPKSSVDIYNKILEIYNALIPLEIQSEVKVVIDTDSAKE